MRQELREQDVLDYHEFPRAGKTEVVPTKACLTQRDLSMAYTPGVARPCKLIEANPDDAFRYTNRGNLVAVVSNGTAVLGLGDIGALAGKPVMEGKGVLFKRFAGIDVFDIELDTHDPDEVIRCVQLLEPTFGGINLEDIKAPECFYIEKRLKETMKIPIFHDDQHGTAIIAGAGLLNALEVAEKSIDEVTVVFCGAGASGIACADFVVSLGVKRENVLLVDTKGVIHEGRTEGMNEYKARYARRTDARTLADAMRGADVFMGCSVKGMVTPEMLRTMADRPIVFAMANPDPEIDYPTAMAARDDIIMATGRSDYPNQINNVLGFPFIFRGALDVRATRINEEMKKAAAQSLAELAKEPVPDAVQAAYGGEKLSFGRGYLIPKPFDQRVLLREATAVARAAMETGVAGLAVDLDEYQHRLERFLGEGRVVMRVLMNKARDVRQRIVFPEGQDHKVLTAVRMIVDNDVARPILLGNAALIRERIAELRLDLTESDVDIVDPRGAGNLQTYGSKLWDLRKRSSGLTPFEAQRMIRDNHNYALIMVLEGAADGVVCGVNRSYPETIRPALQLIGMKEGIRRVAGMYLVILREKIFFFADATVNIDPPSEVLADVAVMAADMAREFFGIEPRVAMLSFSNFASVRNDLTSKVSRAVALARSARPDLVIDGEMQADTALVPDLARQAFPHSAIQGDANILIFPDLQSGNIAYKLAQHLAKATVIGPILIGMRKPVNVLNHYSSANEILHITAITAVQARAR